MKQCSKCSDFKHLECFSKNKKRKDGLQTSCKACDAAYYRKNSKKINEYKNLNKDKKAEYDLLYRKTHSVDISTKSSIYYQNNKEYIKARNIAWQKTQKIDSHYNISKKLRDRLNKAIKNNQISGNAIDLLGCDIGFFKKHIESMFKDGMVWENYGFNGWHIDHIKPLASFDLSNQEELKKACHYTNLQPLWALDNLRKAKK